MLRLYLRCVSGVDPVRIRCVSGGTPDLGWRSGWGSQKRSCPEAGGIPSCTRVQLMPHE